MSGSPPPVDPDLIQALRLHLAVEEAFGIEDLPPGPAVVRPAAPDRVASPGPASIVDLDDQPSSSPTESQHAASTDPAPQAGPSAPEPASSIEPASGIPGAPSAEQRLAELESRIAACQDCRLGATRTKAVPGQGSIDADLMFVGEAPGYHEDQSGLAFVGPAGQLLTKMIGAMGLSRDDVYIANVLKCRPPENRDPRPDEANACFHYLMTQIDLVRPRVICALGAHAANNLLERSEPMGRLRGRVFPFRGIEVVPTYHPSYLLRSPGEKRKAWEDLQVVMQRLGLERPEKLR